MISISPFERAWEQSHPSNDTAPDNVILRLTVDTAEKLGVIVLADIMPAANNFHHMIVVAPSYGSHNGERDISDYPVNIRRPFNEVSDFFNTIMRKFADPTHDEVVKRLVSNNKIKNHPHQILYIAPRDRTLSEDTPRHPADSEIARAMARKTVGDLVLNRQSNARLAADVRSLFR